MNACNQISRHVLVSFLETIHLVLTQPDPFTDPVLPVTMVAHHTVITKSPFQLLLPSLELGLCAKSCTIGS